MIAFLLASALASVGAPVDVEQAVRDADWRYWEAFNACDARRLAALTAPDAEFYHDKTGLTASRSAVVASLMKGPCGTAGLHVRREVVAESVQFDPVPGFGAILTGRHRFYGRVGTDPERLDGEAQFAVVWQLSGKQWQMRRILSYAHRPVRD